MKGRQTTVLGMLLVLASLSLHAQTGAPSVDPYEEFGKHLRAAQEVTPLKSDLFGDQVSLYNGATEFDVTDIDLPGNSSLPVQLRRRLVIDDRRIDPGRIKGMGDWDVDVPYIEGVFTQQDGWVVADGSGNRSTARCSIPALPYVTYPGWTNSDAFFAEQLWDGNQVHIPGDIDEEMLKNTEAKLPAVTDGRSYPWVTKSYYRFGCLASTYGMAGESFYALSPNGEKYTFNWAVQRVAPPIRFHTTDLNAPLFGGYTRFRIFLLATRVEDRFGNWVTYTYNDDHLVKIAANDGREIDITWSGNTVTHATAGNRTWSYGYNSNGLLTSVTRPDMSKWIYTVVSGSLKTVKVMVGAPPPMSHCQSDQDIPPNSGDFVYGIDAPSGARGTFTFHYQRHGRTGVPYSCLDGNPDHAYPAVYAFFDNFTLLKKQISGAGLGILNWVYDYGEGSAWGGARSYFTASGPYNDNVETYIPLGVCTICLNSATLTVTEPGDVVKYTFGISYANNEGRLLQTETESLSGQVLKTVTNTYLAESQVANEPFPPNVGQSLLPHWKNPMVGRIRPDTTTTTVQDGDTYTHQAEAFDAFAQPTKAKRFNNIAGQAAIEEQTDYYNDLTHWVLGQPLKVVNLTTGETESQNTYNASNATLKSRARFGEILLSYTYDTQGQLASFTDGNAHTTALSNYRRGIPQLIHYPDNTSQSAVVDDYGEITAVTDQAGHTTSYAYSAGGWPSKITYPAGDEVSWYPKLFSFAYVTSAERGVAGGHWRRAVSTGNASTVTYFDAMLRPLLSDSYIAGTAGSDVTSANSYDWRGLTTFASYPVSGAPALSTLTSGTHSTYDILGRLTKSQQDSELGTLTTTTAYLSGAGVRVTDPKGNITTSYAQVFDEPSYDAPIKIQAPGGVTQTISRDLYGHPLSITQSGLYNGTETDSVTKTLTYDVYHRLCRITEPESGSAVVAYDNANNLAWSAAGLSITGTGCGQEQVTAAARTTQTYDPMNRVLTILPPAGTQSTQYAYTVLGQPSNVVSGISTWAGSYNYRGMLTGESLQLVGQNAWDIGYGHDAHGSLSVIGYPKGETVSYAPDARGRPTQVGSYASGISYFPNGQVSQFVYGNGTAFVAEQNTRQMLSNFSYGAGGTPQLSEDLSYDANGNITTVTDLAGGPRNKSFGYDALNRLTSAQAIGLWGSETYTYDPLNNLRMRLSAGQTLTYNYDITNKLTSISNGASMVNSFLYDNRGNVTSKNGNSLVFDQKNQLMQIPGYDSYAYDAAGRRVTKTPASGGSTVNYFYNQRGQLMYQYASATATATNFIYLGTKLIARHELLQLAQPGAISFNPNPNGGDFTVSWGSVAAATSYSLQQRPAIGSWENVYTGSSTSVPVSSLAAGGYFYRAQACVSSDCGDWTTSTELYVWPAIPSITVPTGTFNGPYTVTWTTSADSMGGYTLQESLNGGAWISIQAGLDTSVSRPGNVTGSYTYRVEVSDEFGYTGGWSAISAPVTVNTSYGVTPTPAPEYSVPAVNNTGTQTISWTPSTPVTTYTLQENAAQGIPYWITVFSGAGASATLSNLTDGTYSFRLNACNTAGGGSSCTAWVASGPMTVEIPPGSAPVLTVPTGVMNVSSYSVRWTSVATATTYNLQQQVNGGSWAPVQATSALSFSVSGQTAGTYGYRVQACYSSACGPWSNQGTVTVVYAPSSAPSLSGGGTNHTGSYRLSWSSVVNATSYLLWESNNGGSSWTTAQSNGTTSWIASGRSNGTYRYLVAACNAGGCGPWSGAVTMVVTLPPLAPATVTAPSYVHGVQYYVTWSASAGATSYNVQKTNYNLGTTVIVATTSTTSATRPAPQSSESLQYAVQACNAAGCSAFKNAPNRTETDRPGPIQ